MNTEVTTIAHRVRAAIALNVGREPADITDDKTIAQLGGDSLDGVECVMSIEDEFHIEIGDNDAEKLEPASVKEWVQYVEARMAAKHNAD